MSKENIAIFLIAFAITMGLIWYIAYEINVWTSIFFTELGQSYNVETLPTQLRFQIFLDNIWIDLPIAIIIGFVVGIIAVKSTDY